MTFELNQIYHIYNQGNNRQKVFFNRENYLFFLKKIIKHILPFADVLAWCLMPNHFHLMIAVRADDQSERVSFLKDNNSPGHYPDDRLSVFKDNNSPGHYKKLNNSIATMLSSYTRAINIQQKRTGSLFREGTKAVWLGSIETEKIKHQNRIKVEDVNVSNPNEEYLQTCFKYIHENPVKAGFANQITDWEFSSASDIAGIRKGTLINKKLIDELGLCLEK